MLKLLLSNNSITDGNDACGVSLKLQKTKIVFFYDFLLAEKINFTIFLITIISYQLAEFEHVLIIVC